MLGPVAAELLHAAAGDAHLSAYSEAIACRCRSQAPLAGASLDRRALLNFVGAMAADRVEALVCFSCACIHTYLQDLPFEKQRIRWHRPVTGASIGRPAFLGLPFQQAAELIGLATYLGKYDALSATANLTEHEAFEHWSIQLPAAGSDGGNQKLLCCPEDPRVA